MSVKVYRIEHDGYFDYIAAESYENAVSFYIDRLTDGDIELDELSDNVVMLDDETVDRLMFHDIIDERIEMEKEFPYHLATGGF